MNRPRQFNLKTLLFALSYLAVYFASSRLFSDNTPASLLPVLIGACGGAMLARTLGFHAIVSQSLGGGFAGVVSVAIPLADAMIREPMTGMPRFGGYGLAIDSFTVVAVLSLGFLLGAVAGLIFSALMWLVLRSH